MLIILAALMVLLQQEQKEQLCFTFADLGVAVIEAHEAGVPLNKALSLVNDPHIPEIIRPMFKEGILKEYSHDPTGESIDRQRLIDRFAAECMLYQVPGV